MESNQAQCLKIQDKYADKVETFAKCVVKAAKAVHAVSETSEIKCQEVQKALDSENMDLMRVVIQKYIRKYRVDWSHFSDVRFRYIDQATYEQLPMDELRRQLQGIIALVYKDTAFKTGCKEVFKTCVRCELENSGAFTKKELNQLDYLEMAFEA